MKRLRGGKIDRVIVGDGLTLKFLRIAVSVRWSGHRVFLAESKKVPE